MKVFVHISAACLLVQLAFAAKGPVAEPVCDAVCPETFPIDDNWHIPYIGDCTKFCHCANDGNWKKNCPPGLHFNAKLQVCDWPASAGCEGGSDPEPTNAPSEKPTQKPTQKPIEKPTTAASSNVCDNVCPNVFPITENNHLPYLDDCSKFCHCANDGNWEKNCPPGLHFNAKLQLCDWPANAGCEENSGGESTAKPTDAPATGSTASPTPVPTDAPASKPVPGDCEGTACGNDDCFVFPASGSCQAYCDCNHGDIIHKECANGLYYNPKTGDCDWPENVDCEITPPANGCEHVVCNDQDCYKTWNTLDCNLYCDCDHGNVTVGHCAVGIHWNAATESCDFPENAGCEVSKPTAVPTAAPTATPTAAPTAAPTALPGGLCDDVCPKVWPVEENNHMPVPDCTKFCHCANDGNWLKDCPPGLHFNPSKQVCDWPADAGCQAQI